MLKIACLPFNPIQENTYVLWDETNECVVIDAGNSSPREDAVEKGEIIYANETKLADKDEVQRLMTE